MSNDLISRGVTEKLLRAYADEVGCHRGDYELANGILKAVTFLTDSENVPTAYDVDKVVELEKENEEMKEVIRKLLCSEYGSSCQFCIQDNNDNAMCMKMGGSGSWCCENATYDRDWNKRQVK